MTFTVYSKPSCPMCDRAKNLLKQKGIQFVEQILDVGQPKVDGVTYITREELLAKIPTAKAMPQITLEDKVIGGFTELQQMIGA